MASPAVQLAQTKSEVGFDSSRERWIEVGLVVFVVVAPLFLSSLGGLIFGLGEKSPAIGDLRHVIGIATELSGLALVWYVLRRTKRTFGDLGLRWSLGQIGTGFLVAFIFLMVTRITRFAYGSAYLFWTGASYHGLDLTPYLFAGKPPLMFSFLLIVPFFEEIIVRGYLTTELTSLTGSGTLAAVASVLLQTSYHLYQGWVSAGVLLFGFSVPAIYYAKTKKLLPVIVSHGLVDLLAFAFAVSKR